MSWFAPPPRGHPALVRPGALRNNDVVEIDRSTDASTRDRVAASVLRHGPSTAAALAERLGLTSAAIRRHTTALVEAGHLEERDAHARDRGRGRPAKVFALTAAGRQAFDHGYDALALDALDFLAAHGGDDAVRAFAQSRAKTVEENFLRLREERPDLSAEDALAEALTDAGYVASAQPVTTGAQLCQHHCPVAHVAERYPQLCQAETEAFSRVLGSHVQRLATIAHGDNVCTTHIPARHVENRGER